MYAVDYIYKYIDDFDTHVYLLKISNTKYIKFW